MFKYVRQRRKVGVRVRYTTHWISYLAIDILKLKLIFNLKLVFSLLIIMLQTALFSGTNIGVYCHSCLFSICAHNDSRYLFILCSRINSWYVSHTWTFKWWSVLSINVHIANFLMYIQLQLDANFQEPHIWLTGQLFSEVATCCIGWILQYASIRLCGPSQSFANSAVSTSSSCCFNAAACHNVSGMLNQITMCIGVKCQHYRTKKRDRADEKA